MSAVYWEIQDQVNYMDFDSSESLPPLQRVVVEQFAAAVVISYLGLEIAYLEFLSGSTLRRFVRHSAKVGVLAEGPVGPSLEELALEAPVEERPFEASLEEQPLESVAQQPLPKDLLAEAMAEGVLAEGELAEGESYLEILQRVCANDYSV